MTAVSFDRPGAFRIGRVFSDSFAVLGRNLPLAIGIAAIFSGIPTFLFELGFGVTTTPEAMQDPNFVMRSFTVTAATIILSVVLSSILQSALIRATIDDLNGKKPSFGDCLGTAMKVLLPSVAIGLLVGIGVFVGLLLLIVPGVMLWLRWSVAIPALVQEGTGVLGSMGRSAALTKGSRWALFGLYLILIIAVIVLQLVLGMMVGMFSGPIGSILSALVQALLSMVLSTATAVAYVELRLVKEGTSVGDLARIFA